MPEKNSKHIHSSWKPSLKMLKVERHARHHILGSDDEFKRAFEIIDRYPKRVTIFGSARDSAVLEVHRKAAHDLAFALAQKEYAIVTGGGGGIMMASNEGAYDAGGVSIGFNIQLPHEQHLNPYTTENLAFHYFFTRKVMMTFFSHAYVYFPGGFGTFDELTEIITMIQTKKMPPLRIVLFGHEFWDDFDALIKTRLLGGGFISPGDEDIYTITDSVEEAVHLIDCVHTMGEFTTTTLGLNPAPVDAAHPLISTAQ